MGEYDTLEEQSLEETKQTSEEANAEQSGEIKEILRSTKEQHEIMDALIKNQIVVKDALIDKLHKELEYYKQEAAERFINQFMKSFVKVRKDMARLIESDNWNELSAEDMRREYTYIFEDVTDLLEQQNVDVYRSAEGDEFDPAIHQPKLEATSDQTLDKKIKCSVSDGYMKSGKVLIPERVIVYQYK